MKALLLLFGLTWLYQASAQKSLAIDVFTLGHFKRIHIYQHETLTYKLKGSSHKQQHTIVDMQDSVLYIETGESIRLDQVKSIIIDRSNFLTRMLASGFRIAGIGYIAIDVFNSVKNGDTPVFKERVLVAGACLFVLGEVIHIANKRRLHPGRNVRLQIIDLSIGP